MSNKSIIKSLEEATEEIRTVGKKFMAGELQAQQVSQYAKLHNANAAIIMTHIKAQESNVHHGVGGKAEAIKLS